MWQKATIYSDASTPSADFASNDSARQLLGVPRDRARLVSWTQEHLVGSRPCASRCPAPPPSALPGLMEGMCAWLEGHQSASPQVVRRKRPLRRPFSGKRRESPLTAGGGARNISPCAADGRKRRGGALGAPGTLKTGYRGKRIGTRAGPPPAWSRRRSPTRDQFHKGARSRAPDHHSDGFFFILIRA